MLVLAWVCLVLFIVVVCMVGLTVCDFCLIICLFMLDCISLLLVVGFV